MFLADSNVLIDIATFDAHWSAWSSETIRRCGELGPVYVNEVTFAEFSSGYLRMEEADAAIPERLYPREPVPFNAAFVAGQAFRLYRRRGGARTAILSDFLIGAHALVRSYSLITRDAGTYRSYFPRLALIAPA